MRTLSILLLVSIIVPLAPNTIVPRAQDFSAASIIQVAPPSNQFITTLQFSRNSSDFAPYLITPATNRTAFVVAFTQRNGKPPLSQIFNYTVGTDPKPILTRPLNGTVPTDIVYDSGRGRVWFLAGENLTYFDPGSKVTTIEHTFSGDNPLYMATDQNQRIWLTLAASNRVAEYDPSSKQLALYNVPTAQAGLAGIAVAPDNSVWFAEPYGAKLGHIMCIQTTCSVSEFRASPEIHVAYLIQITIGTDGIVWFTDHGSGEFGSFNPSSGEWKVFPIGYCSEPYNPDCPIGLPNAIAFDSNGKVWFSEHVAGRVAEFDPASQRLIEFVVPSTVPPYVWWMQPGPGNLVWFTAYAIGKIGYVNASATVSIRVNTSPTVALTQGQSEILSASVLSPQSSVFLNVTANGNDAQFGSPALLYGHPNGNSIGPSSSPVNATFTVTAAWNLSPGDRYIALTAYNGQVQVSTFVKVHVVAQYFLATSFAPFLGLGSISAIVAGTSFLYLRRRPARENKIGREKSRGEVRPVRSR